MANILQNPTREIFKSQWINPTGIVDLLLLVGGDVIQTSLAQLTGDRYPTPVVFSFGWVAYAFIAVASVVGDNHLLRKSDTTALLINGTNGFSRSNRSWIIGRILRDFETKQWMGRATREALQDLLKKSNDALKAGLCVSFIESRAGPSRKETPAEATRFSQGGLPSIEPVRDPIWKLGYLVLLLQLVVAAIPWIIWQERGIFLITACGSLLAMSYGSLPIWRDERWAARTLDKKKTVILTSGNGAQHALVIFCEKGSLDLEDLATSDDRTKVPSFAKFATIVMLILWFALLLSVNALEEHSWFLIAVGLLGMLYCVAAAGTSRKPQSYGIDLVPFEAQPVIANRKVMLALVATEMSFPAVGRSMLKIFFPDDISPNEQAFWDKAQDFVRTKWPPGHSSSVDSEAVRQAKAIEDKIEALQSGAGSHEANGGGKSESTESVAK